MKLLLYALALYLLYRLVFGFIVPVYLVSRKMKKTFNEMKTRMQEQQTMHDMSKTTTPEQSAEKEGEYIDYEEVK